MTAYSMTPMRIPIALSLVVAAAACNPTLEPEGPPAISGSIVARDVAISIGGAPTVHVKETTASECGIVFLVRRDTPILRRMADGRVGRASLADLTVGRRIDVWAEVVMESCPGQASATAIRILD